MLKAVAPVLLLLATVATPAAALSDLDDCRRVYVTVPTGGERGITYCPGS
jgi:hypothetical protein